MHKIDIYAPIVSGWNSHTYCYNRQQKRPSSHDSENKFGFFKKNYVFSMHRFFCTIKIWCNKNVIFIWKMVRCWPNNISIHQNWHKSCARRLQKCAQISWRAKKINWLCRCHWRLLNHYMTLIDHWLSLAQPLFFSVI